MIISLKGSCDCILAINIRILITILNVVRSLGSRPPRRPKASVGCRSLRSRHASGERMRGEGRE